MFRKKYKTALPTNFLPNLIQLFSPTLIIILIIFLIVALLIGIVFILLKGLFTAVMVGGTLFVMVWLIMQTKMLPKEKYPALMYLLAFIPILGFLLGWYAEASGAFYVVPLTQKPEPITPPYMVTEPFTPFAHFPFC